MVATKTTKTKPPAEKAKKAPKARPAKAEKARPSKPAKASNKPKKLSALDAAAKLLGETGKAMATKELIETMAAKGYWRSPGGATPWATLHAAILRELKIKGREARFKKAERGKFTLA